MNNPNLVTDGTATRFGQPGGPDPRGNGTRAAPWSIRRNLRRLMSYPLDAPTLPAEEDLLEWLAGPERTEITLSMKIAVCCLQQALHDGTSMISFINATEGQK